MKKENVVKIFYISMVGFFAAAVLILFACFNVPDAKALGLTFPVGGRFVPAIPPFGFDIYTPIPFCGLAVTVIGPNSGIFLFQPPLTQVASEYFLQAPFHAFNNALGFAIQEIPGCPPTLHLLNSSLIPGL